MNVQAANGVKDQLHAYAIHSISERYHVDESAIRELYERRLKELSVNATITSFLPVLVERYVKTRLVFQHNS